MCCVEETSVPKCWNLEQLTGRVNLADRGDDGQMTLRAGQVEQWPSARAFTSSIEHLCSILDVHGSWLVRDGQQWITLAVVIVQMDVWSCVVCGSEHYNSL